MKVKISIPVYNFDVWVTDWKQAKVVDKGVTEDAIGGLCYWNKGQLCVWVSTYNMKYFKNLVCHEAVHVALEILGLLGVPADKDNQEALAYLTAYVRDEVEKIYTEARKRNKKGSTHEK